MNSCLKWTRSWLQISITNHGLKATLTNCSLVIEYGISQIFISFYSQALNTTSASLSFLPPSFFFLLRLWMVSYVKEVKWFIKPLLLVAKSAECVIWGQPVISFLLPYWNCDETFFFSPKTFFSPYFYLMSVSWCFICRAIQGLQA